MRRRRTAWIRSIALGGTLCLAAAGCNSTDDGAALVADAAGHGGADTGSHAGDSGGLDVAAADGAKQDVPLSDIPLIDVSGQDTGSPGDEASEDTGLDAVTADVAASDAGAQDVQAPDAGGLDAEAPDTTTLDAASEDTGAPDVAQPDVEAPDAGTPDGGTPDAGEADAIPYATGAVPTPKFAFSATAEDELDFTASAPAYTLPVALPDVLNLADVGDSFFPELLTDTALRDKLAANGAVALPGGQYDLFHDAYNSIQWGSSGPQPPTLVTSDSLLHLYHIFFDQVLKHVELVELGGILEAALPALVDASLGQAATLSGDLGEAALRNAAFFSVAAKLLLPGFSVPPEVAQVVNDELALIDAHKGLAASPLFNQSCPDSCDPCDPGSQKICADAGFVCSCEDYSQYVPRGHYTQSEGLERYFRSVMWLGRRTLRIKSDVETRQAVLATAVIKELSVQIDGAAVPVTDLWMRVYKVTQFFVGASDDLTFAEYDQAVVETFGEAFDLGVLLEPDPMAALKEKLAELRKPAITSDFISVFLDATAETAGWRFLGQRYVPDSYMLGQMVFPHVGADLVTPGYEQALAACGAGGKSCEDLTLEDLACICYAGTGYGPWGVCRLLPRGLDVMAVLGSGEAQAILQATDGARYCGFDDALSDLSAEFASPDLDWMQNAYWSWLHALKPLLGDSPDGYPAFMKSAVWRTKELNTALASWAELRHDTILYAKQSYTGGGGGGMPFAGYVEPVPTLWNRLLHLTAYTRSGLGDLGVLPPGAKDAMEDMEGLLTSLRDISVKELTAQPLDFGEQMLIVHIGDTMAAISAKLTESLTIPTSCTTGPPDCAPVVDDKGLETVVVADVHTDGNTKKVLEEGSGYIDWIAVIHKLPTGELVLSFGPIFSYYELPQPMAERLTDETWRELLDTAPPDRPVWVDSMY